MWSNLSQLSVPASNLALRSIVIYFAMLILLRVSGKRQVGQMSPVEFVAIMLLSNAVQNSMNGGDTSLFGGILSAVILVLMSWIISMLSFRYKVLRHFVEGVPTLLVHKGNVIEKNMKYERITKSELITLLRRQGVHSIGEVRIAILESDGSLSVTRNSDPVPENITSMRFADD